MIESNFLGLPVHTGEFVERIHRDDIDRMRIITQQFPLLMRATLQLSGEREHLDPLPLYRGHGMYVNYNGMECTE